MKHLGDISKINGAEIEPVDIITFGSPCQDLSVAGKRAGLKHETNGDGETTRSGLFMEAVRIIKEMREATDGKYPRFALWENVPGAFSSNKGEDFRIVLEELIKIAEPGAAMPAVPPFGWAYADSYVGDGWSLAYRVFDTQYWPRTPQRRRRIYLVADFGGQRAREVLFEREGLRGHLTESPAPRERVTAYVEVGPGAAAQELTYAGATQQGGAEITDNGVWPTETAAAGMSGNNQPWICKETTCILDNLGGQAEYGKESEVNGTLRAGAQGAVAYCYDARGNGDGETSSTITGDHENRVTDYTSVVVSPVAYNGENVTNPLNKANPQPGDPCHTLGTDSRNYLVQAYGISSYDSNAMKSDNPHSGIYEAKTSRALDLNGGNPAYSMETFHCATAEEKVQTLKARDWKDPHVVAYGVDCRNMNEYPDLYPTLQAKPNGGQSLNFSGAVRDRYIVRRLTPTECARLQGFPDTWGKPDEKENITDEEHSFWLDVRNTHAAINGKAVKEYTKEQMLKWYSKLHSDSAEYKMWGNGIALPPTLYCMQGIKESLNMKMEEREYGMDF
jgi:DNA (cytosine-5)-methyltransferase 1